MCTISTFLQVSIPKSNVLYYFVTLRLLVNMPVGLREDPYHWTELPSLNKDFIILFIIIIIIIIIIADRPGKIDCFLTSALITLCLFTL